MAVVNTSGDTVYRNRVEHWDETEVTIWQEDKDERGTYVILDRQELGQDNPQAHWYTYKGFDIDGADKTVEPHSWERPPIAELKNNKQLKSDLYIIKRYIDAVDLLSSGYLNDLSDIQLMFWVLRGYDGQDLREFMTNLVKYKAMAVSEDGGVDAKTMEISLGS